MLFSVYITPQRVMVSPKHVQTKHSQPDADRVPWCVIDPLSA